MNVKSLVQALLLAGGLSLSVAGIASVTYSGPPNGSVDTAAATDISFSISDTGTIQNIDVYVSIDLLFADDVTIWLKHNTTTVQLYAGHGDTWESAINATFSDSASSSAPYSGSVGGGCSPIKCTQRL